LKTINFLRLAARLGLARSPTILVSMDDLLVYVLYIVLTLIAVIGFGHTERNQNLYTAMFIHSLTSYMTLAGNESQNENLLLLCLMSVGMCVCVQEFSEIEFRRELNVQSSFFKKAAICYIIQFLSWHFSIGNNLENISKIAVYIDMLNSLGIQSELSDNN
jgi:hypothetical protein